MSEAKYSAAGMFSLTRPIARFGPWLVLGAVVVTTLVVGIGYDVGDGTGRLGGDFPSFYAAGEIVLDGQGSDLYDPGLQRQLQADHLPDGEFLYFAYPAFTAAAYAPVAALPYGLAFAIHTALAVLALVASMVAIRPLVNPLLDGPTRLGIASFAALVAYPVLRSVLGGQNAVFTLLLICLVARFIHDDNPVAAGVAAGLMLYKPQFGLIVILILAVTRRWRAVGWSVVVGSGLYAIGALVMDGDWLSPWISAVADFGSENLEVNGHLMVSAWGWFANLIAEPVVAYVIAGLAVAAISLPVLFATARRWRPTPWYALAPMIVVAAPSALYYDATLLVLAAVGMLALVGPNPTVIGVIVLATWTQFFAAELGWSPLFLVIAPAAVGFAIAGIRSPSPDPLDAARV